MNDYVSNTSYEQVAERIRTSSRIMITTHAKPDGDALGSVLALSRAIAQLGREPHIYVMGPLSTSLATLIGDTKYNIIEPPDTPPDEKFDLILIADTGARPQLEPLTDWLAGQKERVIVLDHHVNGDDISSMRIIESKCASATQLIVKLLDTLDVEITGGAFGIAEALMLGLATDTGWFKFSNADAEAFRVAARLLEAGADKSRIYCLVEENDTPQRLAILSKAVASVEYVANGQAAVMCITPDDFKVTGATADELTGIVNEPLHIGKVRVSALLSTSDNKLTKISMRSKPPLRLNDSTIPAIDVNKLAHKFGGGGHVHASGARMQGTLEEVRLAVIKTLEEAVSDC